MSGRPSDNLSVKVTDVISWLKDASDYEKKADQMRESMNPSCAMAFYLLSAKMLSMTANIIEESSQMNTKFVQKICETGICCEESTPIKCIKQLRDKTQQLLQSGDKMSEMSCSQQREILQTVAKGKDLSENPKGGQKCTAGNRSHLEHTFEKGDKNCFEAWFDLIIGQKNAKEQIQNGFQKPLLYPNLFPRMSKAILMYGSPGTGKTMMARALANELSQEGHVRLLMFAPQHSDLKSKYFGESEQKISDMFSCASKWAYDTEKVLADKCFNTLEDGKSTLPKRVISIIFLDEVEVLAGDRASDKTGLGGSTLNTLLQEMDGVKKHDNVVVVAATNYPWQLDSAFLRRFASRVFITLPTQDDIYEFICMEISKSILTFDTMKHASKSSQKNADEEDETFTAKASKHICETCDQVDKMLALKQNSAEGFKQDGFKKFVPLARDEAEDMALKKLCGVFAAENYSLSDMSNVMSQVTRDVGQKAMETGKFIQEEIRFPNQISSQKVYISALCYEDADVITAKLQEEKVFRLPIPGSLGKGIPFIYFAGKMFLHSMAHVFTIPQRDTRIHNNEMYVYDYPNGQLGVLVRVDLQVRLVEGGEHPNDLLLLSMLSEIILFYKGHTDTSLQLKFRIDAFQQLEKYVPEYIFNMQNHFTTLQEYIDLSSAINKLLIGAQAHFGQMSSIEPQVIRDFYSSQIETEGEIKLMHRMGMQGLLEFIHTYVKLEPSIVRIEPIYIEFTLPQKQGGWWSSQQTHDILSKSTSQTLDTLQTNATSIRAYSSWCWTDSEILSSDDAEERESSTMCLQEISIGNKPDFTQLVTDVQEINRDDFFSLMPQLTSKEDHIALPLIIAQVPFERENYKFDTSAFGDSDFEIIKEKGSQAQFQILDQENYTRIVNWNYTAKLFDDAHTKYKSSADLRMITLLEEYDKNPEGIMACMASASRAKLPENCEAIITAALEKKKPKKK